MAEFTVVMRQWGRLCSQHCAEHHDDCDGCILGGTMADLCAAYAMDVAEGAEDIERLVMEWAAKHPEPVYPTWGDWFAERGDLVDGWQNATNAAWMANTAFGVFMNPIPADIAEKLGLQPKEVRS